MAKTEHEKHDPTRYPDPARHQNRGIDVDIHVVWKDHLIQDVSYAAATPMSREGVPPTEDAWVAVLVANDWTPCRHR